jgi:anti-anti-sigma regulatory factor
LFFAYWREWDYARYINVILVTFLVGVGLPEPYVSTQSALIVLIPPALALILAEPPWIWGSAALLFLILAIRSGGWIAYFELRTLGTYLVIIGSMFLSRKIADAAQHAAAANARRTEEVLARVEGQAQALAQNAEELAARSEQQQRLLDLVATLETPAVALAEGVLLAPVVGHLDSQRAKELTARLLREVSTRRTHLVVIDIAGVALFDVDVARALLQTIQALRLLGCEATITGISAAVAITLTQLDTSLQGIDTARTPQEVLARHMNGTSGGFSPP